MAAKWTDYRDFEDAKTPLQLVGEGMNMFIRLKRDIIYRKIEGLLY